MIPGGRWGKTTDGKSKKVLGRRRRTRRDGHHRNDAINQLYLGLTFIPIGRRRSVPPIICVSSSAASYVFALGCSLFPARLLLPRFAPRLSFLPIPESYTGRSCTNAASLGVMPIL